MSTMKVWSHYGRSRILLLLSALIVALGSSGAQARTVELFLASSEEEEQQQQQDKEAVEASVVSSSFVVRKLRGTSSAEATSSVETGVNRENNNNIHRRLQGLKKQQFMVGGIKKQQQLQLGKKKQGPLGVSGFKKQALKGGGGGGGGGGGHGGGLRLQNAITSDGDDNSNNNSFDQYEGDRPAFDFIVGGFPKCGTTTLLKAFAAHDETAMAKQEQCAIASPGQADPVVHRKLDETLAELDPSPHIKRSFKCPTAMYSYKSIMRMEKHSPQAKFVVGVRHPIKMLQSFYNYRVTEIHERQLDEPIPSLVEVLNALEPWKGVSMESTRFELFLMQLGKTSITAAEMNELVGQSYDLAIKPTTFQVFLYTVDQLEDKDEVRTLELRRVMQNFLGLTKPIQPLGHENKNHQVGDAGHKESINICDPVFSNVRVKLIEQGKKTAIWLRDHFINSRDVVIANRDHFIQTLEQWGMDPCEADAGAADA